MESLYRKYRPQTFEDVVGQQHIVSTLEHAVAEGRLSHAYLFCGPRGTGKTTMARILAKSLLCTQPHDHMPCGRCAECQAIAAGTHPDVYELDAASRTGVDNVREEIINSVSFAPVRGSYKVYIIDEVHMLTTQAFNALLKTLEEPPAHVVFVLATTDPQKVPETILSRCQRFDFHRIGVEDIERRLAYVCEREGFETEPEALALVARHARGGMRDALSTLEQLSVFGNGAVRLDDARALLGEVSGSVLAEFARAIAARDAVSLFRQISAQVEQGNDLLEFTRDLVAHARDLYMVRVAGPDPALFEGTAADVEALGAEAALFETSDRLSRVLTVLDEAAIEMRTASDTRLVLEVACTKLARPETDLTLEALAERVARLEAALAGGAFAAGGTGAAPAGAAGAAGAQPAGAAGSAGTAAARASASAGNDARAAAGRSGSTAGFAGASASGGASGYAGASVGTAPAAPQAGVSRSAQAASPQVQKNAASQAAAQPARGAVPWSAAGAPAGAARGSGSPVASGASQPVRGGNPWEHGTATHEAVPAHGAAPWEHAGHGAPARRAGNPWEQHAHGAPHAGEVPQQVPPQQAPGQPAAAAPVDLPWNVPGQAPAAPGSVQRGGQAPASAPGQAAPGQVPAAAAPGQAAQVQQARVSQPATPAVPQVSGGVPAQASASAASGQAVPAQQGNGFRVPAQGATAQGSPDVAAPQPPQAPAEGGAQAQPAAPAKKKKAAAPELVMPAEGPVTDRSELQRRWKQAVKLVVQSQPSRGALLQSARAASDDGTVLTVNFPAGSQFALKMLMREDSQQIVPPIIAKVFGPREIAYTMGGKPTGPKGGAKKKAAAVKPAPASAVPAASKTGTSVPSSAPSTSAVAPAAGASAPTAPKGSASLPASAPVAADAAPTSAEPAFTASSEHGPSAPKAAAAVSAPSSATQLASQGKMSNHAASSQQEAAVSAVTPGSAAQAVSMRPDVSRAVQDPKKESAPSSSQMKGNAASAAPAADARGGAAALRAAQGSPSVPVQVSEGQTSQSARATAPAAPSPGNAQAAASPSTQTKADSPARPGFPASAAPEPSAHETSSPTIMPDGRDIEADRHAWADDMVPYDDAMIAEIVEADAELMPDAAAFAAPAASAVGAEPRLSASTSRAAASADAASKPAAGASQAAVSAAFASQPVAPASRAAVSARTMPQPAASAPRPAASEASVPRPADSAAHPAASASPAETSAASASRSAAPWEKSGAARRASAGTSSAAQPFEQPAAQPTAETAPQPEGPTPWGVPAAEQQTVDASDVAAVLDSVWGAGVVLHEGEEPPAPGSGFTATP